MNPNGAYLQIRQINIIQTWHLRSSFLLRKIKSTINRISELLHQLKLRSFLYLTQQIIYSVSIPIFTNTVLRLNSFLTHLFAFDWPSFPFFEIKTGCWDCPQCFGEESIQTPENVDLALTYDVIGLTHGVKKWVKENVEIYRT